MMKKIMTFALGIGAIVIIIIFCLTSCGIFENETYYEITNIDDLYAMESNKNYRLTCDLDLQEREWYPLTVKNFDGDNYTISNCFINLQTNSDSFSNSYGFFKTVNELKDVTFSNINVTVASSHDYDECGIIAGSVYSLASVNLLSSTLTYNNSDDSNYVCYVGGIVGRCSNSISNCVVDDCMIKSLVGKYKRADVGIVSGKGPIGEIVQCSVKNSTLDVTSGYVVNVGFICGCNSGITIEDCKSELNTMNVNVTNSKETSRVGGIIGFFDGIGNGLLAKCLSKDNVIEVKTAFGYCVGGVAGLCKGKIVNCLSSNVSLCTMTSSNETNQYAVVGGLCGSNCGTIAKSIVQYCKVDGTYNTSSAQMFTGGFVAKAEASVVDCLVFNTTISGGNKDSFTAATNLLHNCYIVPFDSAYPNVNDLIVKENENLNDILQLLQLDPSIWQLQDYSWGIIQK